VAVEFDNQRVEDTSPVHSLIVPGQPEFQP
jgi:hypothetical protein